MLRVSDPDSSSAELVFSSLGNLSAEAGHLEHKDYPGRLVLRFVRVYSLHGHAGFYLLLS